jgi:hypothetical protein
MLSFLSNSISATLHAVFTISSITSSLATRFLSFADPIVDRTFGDFDISGYCVYFLAGKATGEDLLFLVGITDVHAITPIVYSGSKAKLIIAAMTLFIRYI